MFSRFDALYLQSIAVLQEWPSPLFIIILNFGHNVFYFSFYWKFVQYIKAGITCRMGTWLEIPLGAIINILNTWNSKLTKYSWKHDHHLIQTTEDMYQDTWLYLGNGAWVQLRNTQVIDIPEHPLQLPWKHHIICCISGLLGFSLQSQFWWLIPYSIDERHSSHNHIRKFLNSNITQ